MTQIVIKTPPVPVNQKYTISRGKNILTSRYRDAKEAIAWEAKSQWRGEPLEGEVCLNIVQYFGDNRKRDIDAFLKILLDALSGVLYQDDSQITELNVVKEIDLTNPRVIISIL